MTDAGRAEILSELRRLRDRLEKNEQLFNLTADETETEALIYEEKALMMRYSALLRQAKTMKEGLYGDDLSGGNGAAYDRALRSDKAP